MARKIMAELILIQSGRARAIPFEPPRPFSELLASEGIHMAHPCGGRGVCGKCAVLYETEGGAPETKLGCQLVLTGDARVTLPDSRAASIQLSGTSSLPITLSPMKGRLGAALDIGTTTIAARLFRLADGRCLGEAGMVNPQTQAAADVMGRIGYAMKGGSGHLQRQVLGAIETLLSACLPSEHSREEIDALVLTGNTAMLYLLTGRDPEPLSHAPFQADCLFGTTCQVLGIPAYLPPCMNAFVGADITCACLDSGQYDAGGISLLCDIGTNGELALLKDGVLRVCSTAAGPAFEGAGISCGCGGVEGAIDRVWIEDGALAYGTIGGKPPIGLCGSGLLDAAAALLDLGLVDDTGATDLDRLEIGGGIALLPRDIRALQLAKAAIAAGIRTLLHGASLAPEQLSTLYIAGGFGAHLNIESAVRIGLIPASLSQKVRVVGNAALSGACRLLLEEPSIRRAHAIADSARHVNLGGDPVFNEYYMDEMFFPES